MCLAHRLREFMTQSKGGLPKEVSQHSQATKLEKLLDIGSVLKMTRLRAEYMMQHLIKILNGREEFAKLDLADKFAKCKESF